MMAAFRFRLEKVLRYRHRLVDLRSRDVAEAELVLAGIQDRCENLRRRLAAVNDPARAGEAVDVRGRLELAAWYDRQEKALAALEEERRAAAQNVERYRAELSDAWRDREVLERLRQRRREEWLKDQERRERAELDEIGQQRSGRARTAIADAAAHVAP